MFPGKTASKNALIPFSTNPQVLANNITPKNISNTPVTKTAVFVMVNTPVQSI